MLCHILDATSSSFGMGSIVVRLGRYGGSVDSVDEVDEDLNRNGGSTRSGRIAGRVRNEKWRNAPFRIDMSTCINCDTCLRHCPPQFGAIFNHGLDVIIVSELCSGCGKCLPPVCPVDCIVVDPTPAITPTDWWQYPLSADDPYR
jgi:Na+-translocating ferredoxin:NAD+ oxidoreductase subunit B